MRSILLVNPDLDAELARGSKLSPKSVAAKLSPLQIGIVPLGLATIAALTRDDCQVDIWDETVEGAIGEHTDLRQYDLVGLTGNANCAGRAKALGQLFRRRGIPVAVGGPGVSSEPDLYRGHFDVLFIGEAEYTWPRFIADWSAGSYRAEYRQVGPVDMAHSPPPRWDKVRMRSYLMGAVQTTRGCPFDCEFCDVVYIFGRQARHKSIDQVLEEVCTLKQLGMRHVLFCDDNFIGNPGFAKDLVRELIPLNRSFRRPLSFFTNLTLNVARDEEMLGLMADANFMGVFIGIESPNVESLIETNKPQNYRTDLVADVQRIHSYGIIVQSGMIVGFDHDEPSVFDRHFEFLQEAGIAVPLINILKAPKGTKLWARLHKEGRVLQSPGLRQTANVESMTNVIPKQMTLGALYSGYIDLVERVRDWRSFEARARTMVLQMRHRRAVKARSYWKETLTFLLLLFLMDREARQTTLRLLFYVLWWAPSMTERVMGTVAYHYLEALRVPHLKRSVGERIRLLTEEGTALEREQVAFLTPDAFRVPYADLFPELYERVYRGLTDKARTPDVLVAITSDFLTRWGPGFQHFEDRHRDLLRELCESAILTENRSVQPDDADVGSGGSPVGEPDLGGKRSPLRLKRLADDVLRCVEQDLWRLSGSPELELG